MTGALTSRERLRRFFSPASIALVGASDNSGWARNVYDSLRAGGFDGRFVPVHPRHPTAFGIPTRPSLRDLEEPADLAFVLVPTHAVEDVVRDAAAAGIRNVVVLAAGFGERGDDGRALERRLVDTATAHGITLLGPNGLGFINGPARVAPYGLVLHPPLIAGPVGVVLQSGALASAVLAFGRAHAIGFSLLISMGNEAMVTTADVLDYLIEDDATRVIALFLEEIRQWERFAALARRALDAGKPIVALKVGRSPTGQRTALAHTGAVAGDDAVVDAALRQLGVIRVRSLEELLVTAGLLGHTPPLGGRRMGVVTASGGACDIIADRAHEEGIEIPEFGPGTVAALEAALPPFTSPQNPVDVTGYGLANQAGGAVSPIVAALEAVTRDPNVDFVLNLGIVVPPGRPADPALLEQRLDGQAALIASSPVPVVAANTTCTDLGEYARDLLLPRRLHLLAGLELALTAIGHALRWQERRARRPATPARDRTEVLTRDWVRRQPAGVWPETAGRRLLALTGVPMVPAELACSAEEAVAAAARAGYPVAMKICGGGIAHKSDAGGVALDVSSATAVRRAYPRVRRAAAGLPDAVVDGVLISPMRAGGIELLAGVTMDATVGPVLAVGLGGIWVEALRDVALRVLPIDRVDALDMLGELRAAALLRGARGTAPVDLDRVADVLLRVAEAAALVGPSLRALEVNPLWCGGDRIEGLDVLVVTEGR
ncbi:MAG TPA: acetate--CoA ligase family protein [Candidatus Dormibacteraeota bacterium]